MTELAASRLWPLVWLAAGLAALASLAFAAASPGHVEDGWEYRGFFLVVAAAEMTLAVVLVAWSSRTTAWSERDLRVANTTAVVGAIVAGAGVVVYVLTLVTGVQHAGHSAEVVAAGPAVLDIATKVIEVALVAVLVRIAMLTYREDEEADSEG